jgi:hypothetical protein
MAQEARAQFGQAASDPLNTQVLFQVMIQFPHSQTQRLYNYLFQNKSSEIINCREGYHDYWVYYPLGIK